VTGDVPERSAAAQVLAAGDAYIVIWPGANGYNARRLSASTGAWIDAAAFVFDASELLLGSSGTSALAVYRKGAGLWETSVIASTGPVLTGEEHTLDLSFTPLAIASNGREYLIAGSDGVCYGYCDSIVPRRVLAMRLNGGGAPLSLVPHVLEEGKFGSASETYTAAWDGSQWVVLWSQYASLYGAHVSAGGVVTDKGKLVASWPLVGVISSSTLLASGRDLTLIASEMVYAPPSSRTTALFSINSNTLTLLGTPLTLVAENRDDGSESAGAAVMPDRIAVAYDHSDPGADNVPRVFTRIFASGSRRRAARRD
jgi:hypothetical protein